VDSENPTPFELAILQVFYDEYHALGFPSPDVVKVSARKNTGVGRYVSLVTNAKLTCDDNYLDMGGKFIEMEGVSNGLMAIISVVNSTLDELEIATYGNNSWNGDERCWKII